MSIAQSMLPEFDHEMATTRTLLERVPDERAAWTPHPKSTGLGALAAHIATLPRFAQMALTGTELDFDPPGGPRFTPPAFEGTAKTLRDFDEHVRGARAAIAAASDADLMVAWSLKRRGATVFTMPRVGVLRTLMMNHIIHHRGQLSVYLRLNDVPLPSIYGPTADTGV